MQSHELSHFEVKGSLLLAESLQRAWQAGAGPGDGRLIVDVDSFVGEVGGYQKEGAGYGYTRSASAKS